MAGTEGYSLRRWNSGAGRAARHCGSQDVSLGQTSAVQVVCGAGDVEPIARRWEKRPTRCDPKCGQRVGPQVTWLETDRLVTENAQETDLGYSVSENDAPVEDVFNVSMNTFGGDVLEPVVLGQPAHCVAGQTRGSAGSGAVRRRRTPSRRAAGGRSCAVRAVPQVGAGGVRAVHSAQRAGAEAGHLTILLLRFIHARITPFALIVSMSSCMRNIHRHIIHTVQLHVPCMVCMMHDVFRIHRIRWEMGLYEDGVSAYLGKQSHREYEYSEWGQAFCCV